MDNRRCDVRVTTHREALCSQPRGPALNALINKIGPPAVSPYPLPRHVAPALVPLIGTLRTLDFLQLAPLRYLSRRHGLVLTAGPARTTSRNLRLAGGCLRAAVRRHGPRL